MKLISIVYRDGYARVETQGQGEIVRGVPRAIEEQYGYDLIAQGIVEPADEASKQQYEALKAEKEAAALTEEKKEAVHG